MLRCCDPSGSWSRVISRLFGVHFCLLATAACLEHHASGDGQPLLFTQRRTFLMRETPHSRPEPATLGNGCTMASDAGEVHLGSIRCSALGICPRAPALCPSAPSLRESAARRCCARWDCGPRCSVGCLLSGDACELDARCSQAAVTVAEATAVKTQGSLRAGHRKVYFWACSGPWTDANPLATVVPASHANPCPLRPPLIFSHPSSPPAAR